MKMLDYTMSDTSQQILGKGLLPSPDTTHYRHVLSHFATGVTVITSRHCGKPVGFTANSFCSVSLVPSLVSFCVSNSSSAWPLINAAGNFCVNILSEDQQDICTTFARKGVDRFSQTNYSLSASGMPIIDGVLAWIDCRIVTVLPAGDHMVVLGQVYNLEYVAKRNPLIFCQRKFGTFSTE